MYPLRRQTSTPLLVFAPDVLTGEPVTGKVDANWTKQISKNGGPLAPMSVTITEQGSGWYALSVSPSHSDTNGVLTMVFTSGGVKQINLQFLVSTNLPDDIAAAVSGLSPSSPSPSPPAAPLVIPSGPSPINVNPALVATAGALVNSIRELIPDPVYDAAGVPRPDTSGRIPIYILYRWLDDALQELVQLTRWLVEDWYATSKTALVPFYAIDPKFVSFDAAFVNGFSCTYLPEIHTIYPTRVTTSQSLWFGIHSRTGQLTANFWPVANATDPTTTLVQFSAIGPTDTSAQLASTAGFLPFGYVTIDDEIIYYGALTTDPPGLGALVRGMCGTSTATHPAGSVVQHNSLWLHGKRAPQPIVNSLSPLEVPRVFLPALENYVLSKVRDRQQLHEEGAMLMGRYRQQVDSIRANSTWRQKPYFQATAYGQPPIGPLYFGRVIVP